MWGRAGLWKTLPHLGAARQLPSAPAQDRRLARQWEGRHSCVKTCRSRATCPRPCWGFCHRGLDETVSWAAHSLSCAPHSFFSQLICRRSSALFVSRQNVTFVPSMCVYLLLGIGGTGAVEAPLQVRGWVLFPEACSGGKLLQGTGAAAPPWTELGSAAKPQCWPCKEDSEEEVTAFTETE